MTGVRGQDRQSGWRPWKGNSDNHRGLQNSISSFSGHFIRYPILARCVFVCMCVRVGDFSSDIYGERYNK